MLNFLKCNVDITDLSNFKTKAKTKYFFEINELDDIRYLSEIYNFCDNEWLKFLIIWAWTNLLFAFNDFNWVIVKNNLLWWKYDKNMILDTNSNELVSNISETLENDLNQWIWHRFIWLPWSIWWAVFWNAWCFWLETENNFLEAEVLNLITWEIIVFNKSDMDFSYRNSILKREWRYFLISIKFDLSRTIEKYHSDVDNIDFRENKQPKWNSCWSFFKNPNKEFSAWKLIEDVWMKWFRLWTAYFSDLHANFLMSDNNWDYNNLLDLIELVQSKVSSRFNILLENEVRIIK